ncbi:hypothetical protein FQA39_LY19015 [Lamprigera yunnana]|nr:hypothetical protein FQA39_LY19015 [Lamprigera yunnana]
MSTVNDPIPGWFDRQLGVIQIMISIMLGVIRTFHCNFNTVADIVPADYVINCLLAAAMRVSQKRTDNDHKHIPIYNCGTSCQNPVTWRDCYKYLKQYGELTPSTLQVWKIFMLQRTSRYQYLALHFLFHLLPAFIVDSIRRSFGKKSQLVKMYQKLHRFLMLISPFVTNQWIFDDTNTQTLWRGLSEIDKKLYPFDVKDVNWNSYFLSFVLGFRKYFLKDPTETIAQGRLKYLKLIVGHYTIITFVGLAILSLFIYLFC